MTQALYRKWRPLLWDEVVSQEHIVQTLKNAVASNRVAHAYLFSGPRGTGETASLVDAQGTVRSVYKVP